MSAKSKLNEARKRFHAAKIEKTGWNEFSKYKFFELADFLLPILGIFEELKLSGIVSFTAELATLEITDLDDETSIVRVTSPMSTASLKACHEVQNLGAVETYLRRYLWTAALEIVEHDAIDSAPPREPAKTPAKTKPTGALGKKEPPLAVAQRISVGVTSGDAAGAAAYLAALPEGELNAIWEKIIPEIQDELTAAWPGA